MFNGKKIKEKLRKGETVTQVMLRLGSPEVAELMAINGVDVVVIDNEHYPYDPEQMLDIARAVNAAGGVTIARLPNAEPSRIGQCMDMGIDGIWLPSCENYEQAAAVIDAMKFPPIGHRGFCPIVRSADYGKEMSGEEFARLSNENSLCVIQIESKSAVEDIDRILSLKDNIDMISIGPSDLSASYGFPGDYNNPIIVNAIELIKRKAKEAGIANGNMKHTVEDMREAMKNKPRTISIGSDQQILMNRTKLMMKTIKDWQASHKN